MNAVGGIRTDEPAADLAVCLALVASFRNLVIDPATAVMGEVGLTGEVRMISRVDLRVREAAALGFKRVVVPAGNLAGLKARPAGLEIIGASNVMEAMEAVMT